jgi:phosphopantetheine adenylyltransferase
VLAQRNSLSLIGYLGMANAHSIRKTIGIKTDRMVHKELETKKKEIGKRHEELEKMVINSTNREKLEATKEEVGPCYVFQ